LEQNSTTAPSVHLDRFCTRCGRYDLRVDVPPRDAPPVNDREQWMAAQRRKALALRGAPAPEQWVCPKCGCYECVEMAGEKSARVVPS
jgi:hypothetical protein